MKFTPNEVKIISELSIILGASPSDIGYTSVVWQDIFILELKLDKFTSYGDLIYCDSTKYLKLMDCLAKYNFSYFYYKNGVKYEEET